MFFADNVHEQASLQITPLTGDDDSIYKAAEFMVDAFWLKSPQSLSENPNINSISDTTRSSLINIQTNDLVNKYGERLGRRKLDALMLVALDEGDSFFQTEDILGLITVEVRLLDALSKEIMNADKSEQMLTNAIVSLGPKQRREYKDRSVRDIAMELLPPEISAVCSFSNLCVSPSARRRGVAAKLCTEAEAVGKKLGFDEMHLCVQAQNEAASRLYKEKLGYKTQFETNSKSLCLDGNTGKFVDFETDIIIMKKKI